MIGKIIISRGPTGPAGPAGADGEQGLDGAPGAPGPAPSGTGFVKVSDGVLTTPSATIPIAEVSGLQTALNGTSHLRGLRNTSNLSSTTGVAPVSIIILGDSFSATGSFSNFQRGAKIAGAYRCQGLTGTPNTSVTTGADYTKSPDGFFNVIASGGVLYAGHLVSGIAGPATHVYYTLFTGTGSGQLQYSDNGGAWTNIGTAINTALITNVTVSSVALPNFLSQARTRLVASGGTVNGWIGQGVDGPGVTQIDFATVGQNVEQSATVSESIWKAMVSGYKTSGGAQIIWSCFADHRFTSVVTSAWPTKGIPTWAANGPADTLYDWSRVANSTCDWFVIGPHTVNPSIADASDSLVDAAFTSIGIGSNTSVRVLDGSKAQREFAEMNSTGFVDCTLMFPDFAKANAEGVYADDIHLNSIGQDYKRAFVFDNSNIGWVLGREGYRSAIRLGNAKLSAFPARAGAAGVSVTDADGLALVPFIASDLRAGRSDRQESEGIGMWTPSLNVGQIGLFTPGNQRQGILNFDSNTISPVTALAVTSGDMARPWGAVNTSGLRVGFALKTSTYTIARNTSQDYLIACNGTFTVTLPLARLEEATGLAGRVYIIKNIGVGVITVATLTDGTTLQKIDNATTATVAAGATLRLISAQTSGFISADWGNWLTW